MIPWSANNRKRRFLGFPSWGFGVRVPISIKPNPKLESSLYSLASLSKPAARPIGFGKRIPNTWRSSLGWFMEYNQRTKGPTKGSLWTSRIDAKEKWFQPFCFRVCYRQKEQFYRGPLLGLIYQLLLFLRIFIFLRISKYFPLTFLFPLFLNSTLVGHNNIISGHSMEWSAKDMPVVVVNYLKCLAYKDLTKPR